MAEALGNLELHAVSVLICKSCRSDFRQISDKRLAIKTNFKKRCAYNCLPI